MVRYLFVPNAVVLDDTGVVESLRRSFHLTGGYWWRTFGIYIMISLLVNIITGALGGAVMFIQAGLGATHGIPGPIIIAFAAALNSAVNLMIYPFMQTAFTLMYYDLRIRKEGFDVVLRAIPHRQTTMKCRQRLAAALPFRQHLAVVFPFSCILSLRHWRRLCSKICTLCKNGD